MDISKVKLRVKKPGPDSAEENSRANKFDSLSSIEEDFDMAEDGGDEDEGADSSPINLSIKKSSRPSIGQPPQTEAPDKVQRKSTVTSEKEKPTKVKDKVEPEKKVTRQKKTEKVIENLLENTTVKETQTETTTAAADADSKAKRRVNKPAEKTSVHSQAETTESEKDQTQKSDQQRSEEQRAVRQKVETEEEKLRPESQKEHQKNDGNGKENKSLNKPRRAASKKSEKSQEHVEEAQKKPVIPEKIPKERVKEKAAKRKAGEALDLSKKSPSETPSKARWPKAAAAEQLQLKPASENTKKMNDAPSTSHKASKTPPAKKTRNAGKKATGLQQTLEAAKDQTAPVDSPDAPEGFAQPDDTPPTRNLQPQPNTNRRAQNASTDGATGPEETANKPSEPEVPPTCSSGEDTPSPAEDRPPTFLKPTSPPSLVLPGQRSKPADPEDDEGIHSSHEGGSDISDSASEGSDDSGLHGNGAGSGKMANDPETPTDEIPTPTELKSHTCIFCDRTFPLEVEYRRHLNRHLVNVYYMDNTAKGQK